MNTSSNIFSVAVQAPPPAPAFSPDGTTLDINSPAGFSITDKSLATWTKQSQTNGTSAQIGVARNGVRVANSVDLVTIKAGEIYNKDTLAGFSPGQEWEKYVNGAWQTSLAP